MHSRLKILVITLAALTIWPLDSHSITWITLNGPYDARMWDITSSSEGTALVAGERGIYRSTDFGLSWNSVGLEDQRFLLIHAVNPAVVVAATFSNELYRSLDSGKTWSELDQISSANDQIATFASDDEFIYAGTVNGLWRSEDNGESWENFGLVGTTVTSMLIRENGDLLAGTGQATPMYRRAADATAWTPSGLPNAWVWELCESASGTIFAAIFDDVFSSEDNGETWSQVEGLRFRNAVAIAARGDSIFYSGSFGVHLSPDNGVNWETTRYRSDGVRGIALLSNGQNLVASFQEGVSRSFNGIDWFPANGGLPFMQIREMIAGPRSDLAVHDGNSLVSLTPFSANWRIQRNISQGITSLSLGRNFAFWVGTEAESIFQSDNNGLFFQLAGPENRGRVVDVYAALDGAVLAIFESGIVRSAGNPEDWADISFDQQGRHIIGTANSEILVVDQSNQLWVSDDFGDTWAQRSYPVEYQNSEVVDFILATNDVIVVAFADAVISSDDLGENWTVETKVTDGVQILDVQPGFNGTLFYLDDQPDGLYQRNAGETEWENIGEGLGGRTASAITYDRNGRIYAATDNDGIWRAISAVTDVKSANDESEHLSVNPQPANTVAKLHFGRSVNDARIDVIDLRGLTLFSTQLAGPHAQFQLDVSELNSGQYIVRINAADYQAELLLQVSR